MVYRRRFELELEEIKPEINILQIAASELRVAKSFHKVLSAVLLLGNALNGASFRGSASGFQLGDLLKVRLVFNLGRCHTDKRTLPLNALDCLVQLRDTKATSRSAAAPTLLHFLVLHLKNTEASLIYFLNDLPHCEAASRISFGTQRDTAAQLAEGLRQAHSQVGLAREQPTLPHDRFVPVMEVSGQHSSAQVFGLTRVLFLDTCQAFIVKATPAVDSLKSVVGALHQELKDLLMYYGEDATTAKPEELFTAISTFGHLLQVSFTGSSMTRC